MTRHLAACMQARSKAGGGGRKPERLFHLVVEGRYAPMFWVHLDTRSATELADLDAFLRSLWLECCGHLSAFEIDGVSYDASPDPVGLFDHEGRDMAVALAEVVGPGMRFTYQYDFGSTTHLALRVVGERVGPRPEGRIGILARNEPPEIPCTECGAPAAAVCAECIWDGTGWVCRACAPKHECGVEMMLPVVNSPRVGVCGYTGDGDLKWLWDAVDGPDEP